MNRLPPTPRQTPPQPDPPALRALSKAARPKGQPDTPARRGTRIAGTLVGLALLAAAAWVIWDQQGTQGLASAWQAAAHAPLWLHALLLAAVALIALAATLTNLALMRRYGSVSLPEMLALILSATLLNYAPFRPGLLGRVAYHRAVNHIPIGDTIRALIWANALILAASLILLVAVALPEALYGNALITHISPLFAAVIPVAVAPFLPQRAFPGIVRLLSLRCLELLLWGARFWACFALVGEPITWSAAVFLAAAHTLALMIPISGNGLGVSEWFLGVAAALLPPSLLAGAGAATGAFEASQGMLAALLSRLAELVIIVPAGLISGGWLARHLRRCAPSPTPS